MARGVKVATAYREYPLRMALSDHPCAVCEGLILKGTRYRAGPEWRRAHILCGTKADEESPPSPVVKRKPRRVRAPRVPVPEPALAEELQPQPKVLEEEAEPAEGRRIATWEDKRLSEEDRVRLQLVALTRRMRIIENRIGYLESRMRVWS